MIEEFNIEKAQPLLFRDYTEHYGKVSKIVGLTVESVGPPCKLNDMCESNPSVSPYSASIMVALSTLDDLSKAQQNFDSVRMQAKEYVDEAGKARIERDAAVKENETLKAQLQQLQQQLKDCKV